MPEPNGTTTDLRKDVDRLILQMWGFQGNNGLVSEVRALREDIARYRREDEDRRDQEERESVNNRWKRLGVTVALLGAFLSPIIGWALLGLSGGGT